MDLDELGSPLMGPTAGPDDGQAFLEVEGVAGSALRATRAGLTVRQGRPTLRSRVGECHWSYEELASVRVDAYGPIGVVRATVRSTGGNLPLLLLEPEQIAAARRSLEIVRNLMGSADDAERAS